MSHLLSINRVKNCNNNYPIETEYEKYFSQYSFPLSDFQKYAIESIVTGNHTLVTAHTGSGKTLPAEFAITHFIEKNKNVIYTSPIKALSNQKYHEFTQKYPHISFGLFTGDIKTNPNADVLIMTTEILMNMLFLQQQNGENLPSAMNILNETIKIDLYNDLGCVIFDEIHYINDNERGHVWEQTILMLPSHIQMVMLSATIDHPVEFAQWCAKSSNSDKIVYLCSTNHRVVPLTHYSYITSTESIFKKVKDKTIQSEIRDKTNRLITIQDDKGNFKESAVHEIAKTLNLFEKNQVYLKRKHVLNELAMYLRENEMLPAIAFVFSRKQVEACARDITIRVLEDDNKVPYIVRRECEQIIRRFPNYREYLELPEYNQLMDLLENGIGIHHSGMIPVLREIVEIMISKKYIKMLFATESFAIGLDCPIKTAIFTNVRKFDGHGERFLMAHEYTQMAGRAGRRGIDTVGHVIHCNNLFKMPTAMEYRDLLCGKPQKLVSKFRISYSVILNLLKNYHQRNQPIYICDLRQFIEKSMMMNELTHITDSERTQLSGIRSDIEQLDLHISTSRTSKNICEDYNNLLEKIQVVNHKNRKICERQIEILKDEYRFIDEDALRFSRKKSLTVDYESQLKYIEHLESYIDTNVQNILNLLCHESIIYKTPATDTRSDVGYMLSESGQCASYIAEIHPLIMKIFIQKWENMKSLSSRQIVGIFSCFLDIKIAEPKLRPNSEDYKVNDSILEMMEWAKQMETMETEYMVESRIDYSKIFIYDLVDEMIQWCDCETEEQCKFFIQNTIIEEKGISIGDFIKGVLKLATIVKEFISLCEHMGYVEWMYRFNEIEPMILKYVTISQSLYV
jgi:superfamily II RNA helicase